MRKLHLQFKRASQHFAKMGGKPVTTSRRSSEFMCVHVHVSVAYCCRWLAYTLVCVNVPLTVRAGVCHILEVINQAGNQAAAEITSGNETKQAKYHVTNNTSTRHTLQVPRKEEVGVAVEEKSTFVWKGSKLGTTTSNDSQLTGTEVTDSPASKICECKIQDRQDKHVDWINVGETLLTPDVCIFETYFVFHSNF